MSTDVQLTPLSDLFIDNEDCRNIRDFIDHFAIQSTPELNSALAEFEKGMDDGLPREILIDLQNSLRVRLCEFIVSTNHPLFADPLMDEVIDNSKKITFIANFDRQVDELVKE